MRGTVFVVVAGALALGCGDDALRLGGAPPLAGLDASAFDGATLDAPAAADDAPDGRDVLVAPGCVQTRGGAGDFLITLAASPFPEKPNLMLSTIVFVESRSMVLSGRFLDYNRQQLVGEPIVTDPIALSSDGSFRTDSLVLSVPGEANCALPDTAMEVEITLEGGSLCDDTVFTCGVMNGRVRGLGVDLNGSTFTVQRIVNGVIPPPIVDCRLRAPADTCK